MLHQHGDDVIPRREQRRPTWPEDQYDDGHGSRTDDDPTVFPRQSRADGHQYRTHEAELRPGQQQQVEADKGHDDVAPALPTALDDGVPRDQTQTQHEEQGVVVRVGEEGSRQRVHQRPPLPQTVDELRQVSRRVVFPYGDRQADEDAHFPPTGEVTENTLAAQP